MWVLEFTGTSIGQAQDVVRQCAGPGAAPFVSVAGRMGFEIQTGDYELAKRVRTAVENDGGNTIISKR